jgi:O-antigen/teichoic acid export membrane protein
LVPSRETVELVAGSGITAAMTIAYIIYTGRVIGPAEYSDFSAALSVIYFVGLILSPLTPTMARLTASYRARGADDAVGALRRAVLRRVALMAGVVAIGGTALSPVIAQAFRFRTAAPVAAAFLAVLLYALVSVERGVAQGLLLFRFYNANVVIEAAVRLVLAVLIARTASSALFPYVVALAVAQVALARRLRQPNAAAAVDWPAVRTLAVPIMIVMFALAVFQNADMLAVKRWFSPADAGAYGAATAIARAFGVIFVPFYVIAGPLLTSLHEAGKPIAAPTIRLTTWFVAAGVAALLVIAIAPSGLVALLYGTDFARGSAVIVPLGGVAIISYAGLMLAQALLTLHDFRFVAAYVVCAAIQIAGLGLYHSSFADVLRVLYVAQIAALLSVIGFFLARRRA